MDSPNVIAQWTYEERLRRQSPDAARPLPYPAKIGRPIYDLRQHDGSMSVRYALRLLPYVFVRPSEIRHAERTEIDFVEKMGESRRKR
jgi:hypothetical protein